jgi:hypothetical protein
MTEDCFDENMLHCSLTNVLPPEHMLAPLPVVRIAEAPCGAMK